MLEVDIYTDGCSSFRRIYYIKGSGNLNLLIWTKSKKLWTLWNVTFCKLLKLNPLIVIIENVENPTAFNGFFDVLILN